MRYLQILNPWISPVPGKKSGQERSSQDGSGQGQSGLRMRQGRDELERDGDVVSVPYTVIRSDRRTMALQVKPDGSLLLRLPRSVPEKQALEFAQRHQQWIRRALRRMAEYPAQRAEFSEEEIRRHKETLRPVLLHRVAYFAERMGVDYGRITIRNQKTRWGSCSSQGNLNFNWRLALLPPELLDYVVVHELAHRREMNHSRRFWSQVERILPDYRERKNRLREFLLK